MPSSHQHKSMPRNETQRVRLGEMIGKMKTTMMQLKPSKKADIKTTDVAKGAPTSRRGVVGVVGRGHHNSNRTPSTSSRRVIEESNVRRQFLRVRESSGSADAKSMDRTECTSRTVRTQQSQSEHGMVGALTSINEDEALHTFEPSRPVKSLSGDASRTTKNIQRRKIPSRHIVIKGNNNNPSLCVLGGQEQPGQVVFERKTPRNPTSLLPNMYVAGL